MFFGRQSPSFYTFLLHITFTKLLNFLTFKSQKITAMVMNDSMSMGGNVTTQNGASASNTSDFTVKAGLAQMLKGGVIMDVVNAEQVSNRWSTLSCYIR